MSEICYKGSIISERLKEKGKLFFVEELFEGDFCRRAPQTLRKKISADGIQSIETGVKSFYSAPNDSRMVFKSYTHFRRTLDEIGINIKQYFK